MTSRVSAQANLFDYFNGQLQTAVEASSVHLSPDAALYLTTLLVDRARSDRPAPPEQTLAELHARAANAPPSVQAATYRELGDRSLYIAGYFRESITRMTVGPAYYEDMGAAAYHRTDQVFRRWFAGAFGEVFAELAGGFRACVEVLSRVRSAQDAEPDELMRLYDEWLQTGSEELADTLRQRGLIVTRGPTVH